jgi:hypothetical protein
MVRHVTDQMNQLTQEILSVANDPWKFRGMCDPRDNRSKWGNMMIDCYPWGEVHPNMPVQFELDAGQCINIDIEKPHEPLQSMVQVMWVWVAPMKAAKLRPEFLMMRGSPVHPDERNPFDYHSGVFDYDADSDAGAGADSDSDSEAEAYSETVSEAYSESDSEAQERSNGAGNARRYPLLRSALRLAAIRAYASLGLWERHANALFEDRVLTTDAPKCEPLGLGGIVLTAWTSAMAILNEVKNPMPPRYA